LWSESVPMRFCEEAPVPTKALRILVVGAPIASTDAMLERLNERGWGSYSVETLAEARGVLRTIRFALVLAAESLSDGRGYDLMEEVATQSGSLLVCVTLSESCLWLPVVTEGDRTLGNRAVNEYMLEGELEFLLAGAAKRRAEERAGGTGGAKREIPPRRKDAAIEATGSAAENLGRPLLRSSDKNAAAAVEPGSRARASK
jgi:hypothetical protein